MDVPSYAFLLFAGIVAVAVHVGRTRFLRRVILLVANVTFLLSFTHDPVALAPFAALIVLGYLALKAVEAKKSTLLFATFLSAVLIAYCWLKHYAFIPPGLFLPFAYTTTGMSYVLFRIVHLIVDDFQETLPDRVDLLSYLNYTLNFTCLISGPIQLYPDYHRAQEQPLPLNTSALGTATARIITGLFKVSIVSPLLSFAHDRAVASVTAGMTLEGRVVYSALLLTVFPVYLYFNFSGYTDFVIGVARFLGIELPENFNKPFSSKGFIEFWSRWHMSLSNWFKTYVYSPLLMTLMRRYPAPSLAPLLGVVTYFVTFFLVGTWHGQTTMFLFYGVLQGVGVSVNKLYQIAMTGWLGRARYRDLCANPIYASFSRGLTFVWFAFTLLWFWSTWAQLAQFISLLGTPALILGLVLTVGFAAAVLSLLEGVEQLARSRGEAWFVSRPLRTAWCAAMLAVTVSVTVVLNAPAPHIVYKAF